MCGIVGYVGEKQALPILLHCLGKLEYRGYDSAGVCVQNGKNLQLVKAKGKVENLKQRLASVESCGTVGIGHTRWATHGEPSDRNSHPHLSDSGKIVLVHNGIIENEAKLKKELLKKGICFQSETDTEVVANLIGDYYEQFGDFFHAVREAVKCLEGSYALGILCSDLPDVLVAVKKDSPLVFGFGAEENFVASDVTALLKYTKKVAYLEDGEMAVISSKTARFQDAFGNPVEKIPQIIDWDPGVAQQNGYEHFMMKEIMEQPGAVWDTICAGISKPWKETPKKIFLVACGSAYYAAQMAQYTFRQVCGVSAEAVIASEFRYSEPVVTQKDLVILISQSGETADTIAALKKAKTSGCSTLAIVNVVGSTLAKLADRVLYTKAGSEIAVATTKAFSAQLVTIWMLADIMRKKESMDLHPHIIALPEQIRSTLSAEMIEKCRYYADRFLGAESVFYMGRNTDYCICLEGSLKLKEVAYLHSEAYPAGELKHGPIAMIQPGTLVLALVTVEALADKMLANIREVVTRGAEVLCVARESLAEKLREITDAIITVPDIHPVLQPSLSILPLQLFAYYVAVGRGCDVDQPRNLAKSVTVE